MCDTFVFPLDRGGWMFGKNSDREPNEAQTLEYHPPAVYPEGSVLSCTYRTIPQVRRTRGVLISRPFWMWGAEMGINDNGVVIGNEAVFTKEPTDRGTALTGMDILRLALERSGSAAEAVDTIVSLITGYGQGGIGGYEDRHMAYHNSFLAADGHSAWKIETAGPYWAARELTGPDAISNGLTFTSDFTRAHPELEGHARDRGYVRRKDSFDFARSYSDRFYTTFSACRTRRSTALSLLTGRDRSADPVSTAFRILRHHESPDPLSGFLGRNICAHAANSLARNATQTTASLAALLRPGEVPRIWATASAAPCTGIFKPVRLEPVPGSVGSPEARYSDDSLWWRHERLHRSIMADYRQRAAILESGREELEASFLRTDDEPESCFARSEEFESRCLERLRGMPPGRVSPYWRKMNHRAGIRAALVL